MSFLIVLLGSKQPKVIQWNFSEFHKFNFYECFMAGVVCYIKFPSLFVITSPLRNPQVYKRKSGITVKIKCAVNSFRRYDEIFNKMWQAFWDFGEISFTFYREKCVWNVFRWGSFLFIFSVWNLLIHDIFENFKDRIYARQLFLWL